jgi:hypothetical protein
MNKQINVFGTIYKINLKNTMVETSIDNDEEDEGACEIREKYINLFKGLKGASFSKTALHEIGHAICAEYNCDLDKDEKMYDTFMSGLYDTVMRNKLQYLFKE